MDDNLSGLIFACILLLCLFGVPAFFKFMNEREIRKHERKMAEIGLRPEKRREVDFD